ncbi:hypothetical protein DRN63_00480 [Nanoarchaeota archaeon]|nr:MAG: hypothetical protein DRN63_00480 [Nanoarchaeota archaeon]
MLGSQEILIILGVSFIGGIATFLSTPRIKIFLERIGIVGIDQQKRKKPVVATSAGIPLLVGFLTSICLLIFIDKFIFGLGLDTEKIFASTLSIFIALFIGMMDDINVRQRKVLQKRYKIKEYRVGLKPWQKPLLTLSVAVPLMVVRSGVTEMCIPFFGSVDFGLFYNLVLVPIAVVCVTNAYNFLAGMNGLESGLGIVAFSSLLLFSIINSRLEACVLSATILLALIAFIRYNWYPAKFLPGDSLTYMLGATYVSIVIIGNMEKFGILLFIPWIIEAFLKLRSKFKARSLGNLRGDGTLEAPYDKIYSLTHIVMKAGRFREKEITLTLISFELLIAALSFLLVFSGVV